MTRSGGAGPARGPWSRARAANRRPRTRSTAVACAHGAAHLRARERVRRHLHAPRASAGSAPTRSPATCSAGSCRGAGRRNVFLANGARLYLDVGSHPEYATPECDSILDLVTHDKAGERILEQLLVVGRAAPARGGHPRRHLPVQEQHRLGRQQLRLPRELPDEPARRLRPLRRGAHPVPRVAPDLRRRRQGAADGAGRDVLHRPAGRAHLGGRVVGHDPQPPDHQHPRRAPRRRRALPPPARHRRRLEHERVRDVPQGRGHVDPAAHARGPVGRAAGHDAREPDPGHPRDQPRHHLQAQGAPGQRPRGRRRSTSRPSTSSRALRYAETEGPQPARGAGARHVGALPHRRSSRRSAQARPRGRLGHQAQAHRGLPRQARPAAQRTRRSRSSTCSTTTSTASAGLFYKLQAARHGRAPDHRRGHRRGRRDAAADHPGPAARRVHPPGQGAQARLHGRLGAPEAQRPGAAHRALQGPVQGPRRAGRAADRQPLYARRRRSRPCRDS